MPKKIVGEPFGVSLISGIEKFYASEGYVTIFCRNFSSHSVEKFSYGNPSLLCVRKVLVEKKCFDKRGGEYQDFVRKKFCLTVPKNLVGKTFWVSLIWVSKNFMFKGVRHDFSSNFFCLAEPKNFAGEPFCGMFQKTSGSENVFQ